VIDKTVKFIWASEEGGSIKEDMARYNERRYRERRGLLPVIVQE